MMIFINIFNSSISWKIQSLIAKLHKISRIWTCSSSCALSSNLSPPLLGSILFWVISHVLRGYYRFLLCFLCPHAWKIEVRFIWNCWCGHWLGYRAAFRWCFLVYARLLCGIFFRIVWVGWGNGEVRLEPPPRARKVWCFWLGSGIFGWFHPP